MKKLTKRILCFAVCVLLCLGALTSCGTLSEAVKSPETLREKYEEANYIASIIDGKTLNGEFDKDTGTYLQGVENAVFVLKEGDTTGETTGLFFFCDDKQNAGYNESELKDYLLNSKDFDGSVEYIVIRRGNLVYIGTNVTWEVVAGESKGAAGVNPIIIAIIAISVIVITFIAVALLIMVVIAVVIVVVVKKNKKKKLAAQKAQADTNPPVKKTIYN